MKHFDYDSFTWHFPLPRTHTGVVMGNGIMGVMVWGEGNRLCLTLNRGDFWDRRGGMEWNERMTFANIRALLEAGDEAGLRELFEQTSPPPGTPARPSLLPFGRLEWVLPEGASLKTAHLDLETGTLSVRAQHQNQSHEFVLRLGMTEPVLHISLPDLPFEVERLPAWKWVEAELSAIGFEPPQMFDGEMSGWSAPRPVDAPLCVGYRQDARDFWLALDYGNEAIVRAHLDEATPGFDAAVASWWRDYWRDVPRLEIPDLKISFLWRYGMWKFGGMSNPHFGVPPGLQGPWLEEYALPPWQGDYHFNINVQMCLWPAYKGNRLSHLAPLWAMLRKWEPQLRQNARTFVGVDDGYMLPHAVDDRGVPMGGFWSGLVDHGCTAWIAEMMFRAYQYSGDEALLRDLAFPWMKAALSVYDAMLDKDGGEWVLPVSVSPEYRGKAINAWGRNASFQLACIHFLCEKLQDSAKVLGETPDPKWREMQDKLPKACLWGEPGREQIAMWQGTHLEESHRHHSHLAGIHPFDVLDPDDPEWQPIFERTLRNWTQKGMGAWSGWCVPWAAMLHAHFENAEMSAMLLEIWERVFVNEGGATLHDCAFPGFTTMGTPNFTNRQPRRELMQLDASMGAATAICEMMLHARRGVHHLFSGCPGNWKRVGFDTMRAEGGFLVSATRENGIVTRLEIEHANQSGKPSTFRLHDPWTGERRELTLSPGEKVSLSNF